jgi:alpha-methylacyl-CoA racemase
VQPNVAPRFSRTPGVVGRAARPAGADTIEALGDWGVDQKTVDALIADGAVAQA